MNSYNPNLLPIGTVVKLKGSNKPVMIYGRNQTHMKTKKLFDYIAVPYPEGNITQEYTIFFNSKMVKSILHRGYESPIEIILREKIEKDLIESRKMT